jgi:hypothetical protein
MEAVRNQLDSIDSKIGVGASAETGGPVGMPRSGSFGGAGGWEPGRSNTPLSWGRGPSGSGAGA